MSEHDQREDYDELNDRAPLAPARILRWPASIIWGTGLLNLIAIQVWIALLVCTLLFTHFVDDDKTLADAWDRICQREALWVSFLGWPVASAWTLLVMHGANGMRRFHHYNLAVVAVTMAMVSVPFSCTAVVQVPVAIWSICLLIRPDVRARFEAVARGTISEKSEGTDTEPIDLAP